MSLLQSYHLIPAKVVANSIDKPGNQRTSGEESRRQGGKVFGSGSRAPVAIVILVKNPASSEHGKICFHEVADYLTADEKLDGLNKDVSVLRTEMKVLEPNDRHSWLNQENEDFYRFFRMDGKKTDEPAIFENYSRGIETDRDAWAYNSSKLTLKEKMSCQIEEYNRQLKLVQGDKPEPISRDSTKIKWSSGLMAKFSARKASEPFYDGKCCISA